MKLSMRFFLIMGTGFFFSNLVGANYSIVKQAEWTVLVYMNANNNLESYAALDIQEMLNVKYTQSVNVLLQVERAGEGDICGEWSGTYRFKMGNDMQELCPEKGIIVETDNKNRKQLLDEFVQWGKTNFKANKYFLIFWDHGNKWLKPSGVLSPAKRDSLIESYYLDYKQDIENINLCDYDKEFPGKDTLISKEVLKNREDFASGLSESFVMNTIFASSNQNLLTVEEISEVESINDFEIIGFDACLMSTMETAFTVKDKAKFMIASEELVPGCGWNYYETLSEIVRNPAISASVLSSKVVQSYRNAYCDKEAITISSLNLEHYTRLHRLVDSLAGKLIIELKDGDNRLFNKIKKARNTCKSYGKSEYLVGSIDFYRFINSLGRQLKGRRYMELRNLAAEIMSSISKDLIISYYSSPKQIVSHGSNGIAIYFPKGKFLTPEYKENNIGTSQVVLPFIKESKWDNFISDYKSLIK